MTDFSNISKQLISNAKCLSIDKQKLENALEILIRNVLFPICSTEMPVEKAMQFFYTTMEENIATLIEKKQSQKLMNEFMDKLPQIQKQLHKEAEVFGRNDPAANSVEEVIITYPGFFALTVYRIAHEFYNMNVPIIPRLFSEYAHSKVGIDINPGAEIGHSFYIDHGTGIVIGESTIIGNNVTIYQGVTIGAIFVTKELSNTKRHPTIEDNVIIYAGATILC